MDDEIKWFMASRGCIGVRLPHDLSWCVLRPPSDPPHLGEREGNGVRVFHLPLGWRITRRAFGHPLHEYDGVEERDG